MPSEKSAAIILRVVDFSESSCIVTMLTRDFGKITAMAKGARRPKSPFEAAIDVLAICRIVFIHKTTAMSLLTEAKLERRFRAGETDLNRLYAGFYVIELIKLLTDEGDAHPELFQLTIDMIEQLDSDLIASDQLNSRLLQFELGVLDLLGHLPMLTKCVSCGREKTQLSKINFGLNAGGVLCQSCRRSQSNIVSVSKPAFQFLLGLVGGQIGEKDDNSDNWNLADRVIEQRLRNKSWTPIVNKPNETQTQFFSEPNDNQSRTTAGLSASTSVEAQPTQTQFSLENQTDLDKTLTESAVQEVRQLINRYLTHLIGYPPKLHQFIRNL